MAKINKLDKTVKELAKDGIRAEDFGQAGEECMKFLNSVPKIGKLSSSIKMDTCTKILDHQMKNERFSETAERLELFRIKK